jgi:hypothetical protein
MTLPKNLGFNSFLTVDYAPGQDPLIKRRAKRRKGDETETSGPSEAVVDESNTFSHLSDQELDDRTKFHKTKRNSAAGGINSAAYLYHSDMAKKAKEEMDRRMQSTTSARKSEVKEDLDEAVLNPAQRRAKSIQMRRLAPRIRLGQERAKNRFADLDRLKHRATKAARTAIFRKLTKGVPKDELTFQRRQEIEKRLNTPAMKARIERIAIKMLPKERQMEVDRHKSKSAEEK